MDLGLYLTHHASALYNGYKNLGDRNKNLDSKRHFKFSIDRAQLIALGFTSQEQIDKKMQEFMQDLAQLKYEFEEKNGLDKRGGEVKQKYTKRELDFSETLIAYHNTDYQCVDKDRSSYLKLPLPKEGWTQNNLVANSVEPHFHMLLPEKLRVGKNFGNVQKAISELATKHGLVFHFMEESEQKRDFQREVTSITWGLEKLKKWELASYIKSDSFTNKLDLIYKDYKQSGQIQYLIKTMSKLQNRLEAEGLDFYYHGQNIKNSFAIPLTKTDLETLEILKNGTSSQIQNLIEDRDNKIARAWLENNAGFDNIVISELEKRGFEFQKVDISKLDLSNAQKPKVKDFLSSSANTKTNKLTQSQVFKIDFEEALEVAKSETELKDLMILRGYESVGIKTKQGKKVALKFELNGKKHQIHFSNFGHFPKIREKLFDNYKNNIKIDREQFANNSKLTQYLSNNLSDSKNQEKEYIDVYHANQSTDQALKDYQATEAKLKQELDTAKQQLEIAKESFKNEALKVRGKEGVSQEQALQAIINNQTGSHFLTGEGGAGKSYTLYKIINTEKRLGRNVAITASTGVAAANVSGQTLHSFFGIGKAQNLQELKKFEEKNQKAVKKALQNIAKADTIVIDEISMVHKNQMDLIKHRLEQAGFTGKLIYTGDFLQLPPVDKNKSEFRFAFESELWKQQNPQIHNLVGNKRSNNKEFTEVLNRIRYGDNSEQITNYLKNFKDTKIDESEATYIFNTRKEVSAHNAKELAKLEGREFLFKTHIKSDSKLTSKELESVFDEVPIDSEFAGKEGAKVLLLANEPEAGFYNGDKAEIVSINSNSIKVMLDRTGKEIELSPRTFSAELESKSGKLKEAEITGFPIRLAYAITTHKSQGMSIDNLQVSAKKIFEDSQFYVALSRAQDPEKLRIVGSEKEIKKAIRASTKVLNFQHQNLDYSNISSLEKEVQNLQTKLQNHKINDNKDKSEVIAQPEVQKEVPQDKELKNMTDDIESAIKDIAIMFNQPQEEVPKIDLEGDIPTEKEFREWTDKLYEINGIEPNEPNKDKEKSSDKDPDQSRWDIDK